MRTGAFLYALWCMALSGMFVLATWHAWSPFADASSPARRTTGPGGVVILGPTHK